MVFKTERSKGITVLILLINLFFMAIGVLSLVFGDQWVVFFICLLLAAYNDWLLLDIKYVSNSRDLLVKAGPVRRRIDYKNLVKITKTTDVLTGTRLTGSSKSIEIFYRKANNYKSVKISPQPRKQFLEELQSKNPEIKIERPCWE